MTNKRKVLDALIRAHVEKIKYKYYTNDWISGGWVPAWHLVQPDVGGLAGLRRLRDLRDDGLNIKCRYYFIPQEDGNYIHSQKGFVRVKDGTGDYRKTETTIYRLETPLEEIDIKNCKLREAKSGQQSLF